MSQPSDEELMAFVDGELAPEAARRIEVALACDPALARRVEALRALDRDIAAAFDDILDEPVPDRLRALLAQPGNGGIEGAQARPAVASPPDPVAAGAASAATAADPASTAAAPDIPRATGGPGGATVIPFARPVRQETAAPSRTPRWSSWLAMAASLALGVVVGATGGWLRPSGTGDSPDDPAAALLLAGTGPVLPEMLGRSLASAPSGTDQSLGQASLRPVLTFRDATGALCRQFALQSGAARTDALACHRDGRWQLEALARGEAAGTGYATAAGPSEGPVALAVADRIAGEPLDAAAEAAALAALSRR